MRQILNLILFCIVAFLLSLLSLEVSSLVYRDPELETLHRILGLPVSWGDLEFSAQLVKKCFVAGCFWALPCTLLFHLTLGKFLGKKLKNTRIDFHPLLTFLGLIGAAILCAPVALSLLISFPSLASEISVSPIDSRVGAGLTHRGFLQGHSFNLILLQPGLNVEMQNVFQTFVLATALSEPAPESNFPVDLSRTLHWSPDGKRLVLTQGGWALAAWDFERDLFLELSSSSLEALRIENYFVSLLFEGTFLAYDPPNEQMKMHYESMRKFSRVILPKEIAPVVVEKSFLPTD